MQITKIAYLSVLKYLLTIMLIAAHFGASAQSRQPNIIFFLADDQGWNHHSVAMFENPSSANTEFFHTPNIERIAQEGMRFSTAYSAGPMCNPSRRSLHVGRGISPVMFSGESEQEQAEALTIGEMMQSAGYRTAHFGKWSPGPAVSGLDFYDVNDGALGNGAGNLNEAGDPKQIFGISDRANAFIEGSVDMNQPFYIQLSHFAPHTQAHALDETMDRWEAIDQSANPSASLSAMTEDLDRGVGAILNKLDELGIADNTYVIYSSDHGQTTRLSANTPLNSGKGTLWEGGMRVPFIVSGPGIDAASISHERTVSLDLFPTFAALAGVDYDLPRNIEGGSLLPVLFSSGTQTIDRPREELVFHFPTGSRQDDFRPMSTLYLGDYKLAKFYDNQELMLFNIVEDIGEQSNLADAMPERLDHMHTLLVAYLQDMEVNVFAPEVAADPGARGNANR